MFGFNCCNRDHKRDDRRGFGQYGPFRSSGNSSFDAYRVETLRRLEEEQGAFEAFLQRLRDARDKQEFDRFMDERARSVTEPDSDKDGAMSATASPAARPADSDTDNDTHRRGVY